MYFTRVTSSAFAIFLTLISTPAIADTIQGALRDANGNPLPGTALQLQDGQGGVIAKTASDAGGTYQFPNIAAGTYVVLATQKDNVLASMPVSVGSGNATLTKDLQIQAAQAMTVVIAQRRDEARSNLSPKTGATSYQINQQAIESLPQGADTPLDKILLQTPGVAEDSAASGSLHIRGEHANVQYRLNGILLPDGISGFGDTIDPHIIESATLLDGTLPAQYGFRTAGVIDITTKNGFQNSGTASMMGGSNATLQPSVSYGGTVGDTDYFVAASHLSSDLGIENTTSSGNAVHDHTEQNKQFGYGSYMINPMQRVELAAGNSISYYQIPNNPGQPTAGYQVNGVSNFSSSTLNERQFESNQFATIAWQGGTDGVDAQIAPYIRNSELHFRPDPTGDLLFNGVASDVLSKDLAAGLQNDNSWKINGEHTLRSGFTIQNDHVKNDNTSEAFVTAGGVATTDGSGNNFLTGPIVNDHSKDGQLYGIYLQDEWRLTDNLTMNYGARFDDMEQYVSANQLSPRLSFVYKPTNTTTLHAGYARYFTPPPMELVSNGDLGAFANTTNAAAVTANSPVKPERSHNFDAGASQKLGEGWEVGLDGYYKLVHDLLDEGQFGAAQILTPFNYEHGYIYGSELTATYTGGAFNAYGNVAFSRAMGENIVSGQYNFSDPAELAYIGDHYVHLDHDQTYTASLGGTYEIRHGTVLGLDGHYGSGLRSGFANLSHLPPYATFDASLEQKLDLVPKKETAVRLSVVNLLDKAYELRDGSGIGVGAPQWGARRGIFLTLSQGF